jgi:hypothetical protein
MIAAAGAHEGADFGGEGEPVGPDVGVLGGFVYLFN